jgi:hypothetical protein
MATDYGLDGRFRLSAGARECSVPHRAQTSLGPLNRSMPHSPSIMRSERDADHSPPSRTEPNNGGRPHSRMLWCLSEYAQGQSCLTLPVHTSSNSDHLTTNLRLTSNIIVKICGFNGGEYEEWRLLGCYAV